MNVMSEYYFDYVLKNDSGDFKSPKIYFEKDYSNIQMPYTIFAVPYEWTGANPTQFYDKIDVYFDIDAVDCEEVKTNVKERKNLPEIILSKKYDEFLRDGCRLPIDNYNSDEHSGAGYIEMSKNGKTVGRFIFAINFFKKIKIRYSIKRSRSDNGITVKFKCKKNVKGIPVNLVYNTRVPCLKNDVNINIYNLPPLDFSESSTSSETTYLTPGRGDDENTVFSLAFAEESYSKFFVLHCDSNNTINMPKESKKLPKIVYSCPFCHQPIDNRLPDNPKYRRGGISCGFYRKHGRMPTVFTETNQKVKRCLMCSEDFENKSGGGPLNTNFLRLLPADFMEHDSFKIAFLGSARAGKTTYISRFFDLCGAPTAEMTMQSLSNSMRQINVDVVPAKIPKVIGYNQDKLYYRLSKDSWASGDSYYLERRISLKHKLYPQPTNRGTEDLGKYPFIAEVNRSTYVSFYDVAGEDAQERQIVQTLAGGEGQYIGVFCIVSGSRDAHAAHAVFNKLLDAKIHPESPIAVIVTKFDTLIEDFDPNCRCLRTDYFDGSTYYNGSELQKEIDFSSEEIKSYLKQQSVDVELSSYYKNVKYFAVSSFNFEESIHNQDDTHDTVGSVKFECSPSRIELPFVWMLSKFGVIK